MGRSSGRIKAIIGFILLVLLLAWCGRDGIRRNEGANSVHASSVQTVVTPVDVASQLLNFRLNMANFRKRER